jgi:S-adenosylmethionine:tRNA ribosyltransferase-isomerase
MNDSLLSCYDFKFPEELIAHEPLKDRDASRLLVRSIAGEMQHRNVGDLVQLLPEGSLLIVNDSRVFPARILTKSPSGIGEVELLLLNCEQNDESFSIWQALGRPLKKLKPSVALDLDQGLVATMQNRTTATDGTPTVLVHFNVGKTSLLSWLEQNGYIPLPPYIERKAASPARSSADKERYQTVYSNDVGSVAAPTAGLHLSESLISRLNAKGIELAPVTLHVGAGTFLPVKASSIDEHTMHREWYHVPSSTLEKIQETKQQDRPVICVGTTSLRCMESLYREAMAKGASAMSLCDHWTPTELFIRPEQHKKTTLQCGISALMTNFHQPCSTLFILISALIGIESAKEMYEEAFRQQYRLFSYGDANLLWL